jgi:flagellar biosynthetic protein FlhB
MADGEEKDFPATPKKRAEARKHGQVARSPEFSAAVGLLAITCVLHVTLPSIAGQSLITDMRQTFGFDPRIEGFGIGTVTRWQELGLFWAARLILPVMLLAMFLGLAVNLGQVGLQIVPEGLAPKWERLNPIAGFKRILSMQGSVELLKGLVKMSLVGGISYTTLHEAFLSGDLLETMRMPLSNTLGVVGALLWTLGLRVSITLFLLAIADFAWQKHQHEKSMKMSASEIKQEMKQSDGDPQVKARIRRLQREMAKRRMMQDVPKADVIITNPTHYAIALQYEAGAGAPKVLAKGQDEIARRIKELAAENRIPLVENKPLARTLFATVEIGGFIPPDLYEAVAQVLAFVYRTYGRRKRI